MNTTIRATPVTVTRTFTTPVAVPPIRRRDNSQPSDDEDVVFESTRQTPHDDSTLKISDYASSTVEGIPHIVRRFTFPIVTPAPVVGWDAQRISAACSKVATDTSFIYKVRIALCYSAILFAFSNPETRLFLPRQRIE